MKKKVACVICVLASLLLIVVLANMWYRNIYSPVGVFNLEDYKEDIAYHAEYVSSEIHSKPLGSVNTSKEAKEKAVVRLTEIYGKSTINEEKPFYVRYDEANQAWLVEGTMPWYYTNGGVAHIIFQKSDGKVLAVWHEK
jgi:hypothetical protein